MIDDRLGDCREVMPTIASGSVDMILCDLPYGQTRNQWDETLPMDWLWGEYKRVAKENAAIVLFGQGVFSARLILSNEPMYRYSLVWEKDRVSGFLNAKRMPLRSHEDVLVFYRSQPTYNPQMWEGAKTHARGAMKKNLHSENYGAYEDQDNTAGETKKYPRSVLYFPKPHPCVHPTQKPVALCEYLIRTFTNPGEMVLDNCMGSGTVLMAAKRTGRRAIGIELDPTFMEIARRRIDEEKELFAG